MRTPDTLGSASSHISERKLRKGSNKLETSYSSFPVCDKTFSWIVCVYCECRLELELVQIARKHWAVGHHPPHHHHAPHTIPVYTSTSKSLSVYSQTSVVIKSAGLSFFHKSRITSAQAGTFTIRHSHLIFGKFQLKISGHNRMLQMWANTS